MMFTREEWEQIPFHRYLITPDIDRGAIKRFPLGPKTRSGVIQGNDWSIDRELDDYLPNSNSIIYERERKTLKYV